tara:strand:+ start:1501 stop:2391 length:891 start_codon:yes stop_codon:yes gene_type:complete
MKNISFIGLGNMGKPMALNFINKKYNLFLFDINKSNYKPFKKTNAIITNNNKELTHNSNLIISMLPNGKELLSLVLGKKGIIHYIKKNSVFIDCSSIDYKTTLQVSRALKKKGVNFLDAPVSGGVAGAQAASLTMMVGGNKSTFNKVTKILNTIAKNIIYVGKSGSGQIVKACNNMMLGVNMIAISEAFTLSKAFGIDAKVFFEICSKSTGSSWAMLNHLPVKNIVKTSAANNNYKPGYAAKLILKDLKIANEMASSASINNIMGKKAYDIYNKFCSKDKNNLDYSAIIKILSKKL